MLRRLSTIRHVRAFPPPLLRSFWGSAFSATPPEVQHTPKLPTVESGGYVANRKEFLPDVRGIMVATCSWESLGLLDLAIWNYARWSGDPIKEAHTSTAVDPSCILAHCVVAICLLAQKGVAAHHPELLAAMKTNRRLLGSGLCGGEREMVHAAAVEAWASGLPRKAAAIWEAWLLKCPRDLLALRASHDALLVCGDAQGMLESIARVRPMWDNGVHGYTHVLSLHAFALTEATGASSMGGQDNDNEAEDMARAAYAADKKDMWALHALSHVLEHGGRASEGASLLKHNRDDWEALPGVEAAVHLGSHFAKCYIERGNYAAGLRVVDTHVMEPLLKTGARALLGVDSRMGEGDAEAVAYPPPAAITDATAMLWRLELSGVAAGFRWERVGKMWEAIAPGMDDSLGMEDEHDDDNDPDQSAVAVVTAAPPIAHCLTPLQAVHRTMGAVACAELRRAIKAQRQRVAKSKMHEGNKEQEEGGKEEEVVVDVNQGAQEAALSTAIGATATTSLALPGETKEKEKAEKVAALVVAAGGEVVVVANEVEGGASLYSVVDEFGDDVLELESGVHGLDLGFNADYALARQRQLDGKFAAAAEEVALMMTEGNSPARLEECYLPSAVLHPGGVEDGDDWATAGDMETGSSVESSIEHLFGEDQFDDMEGGERFIPSAPRAPFVRDPLGSAGQGIPERLAQVAAVGAVCFWQRNLVGALDHLLPFKSQFDRLGGSVLDQETVYLTLIEAAVRSCAPVQSNAPPEYHFGKPDVFDEDAGGNDPSCETPAALRRNRRYGGVTGLVLARALLSERTALRTGSAQMWVRYAVVLERLGDLEAADMARKNAYALGIGQGGKGAH